MAYIEQRMGVNQRAITAAVVALIQGAAIVALVNGLAVKWIAADPPPRIEGEHIELTPIPIPIPPPPMPEADPLVRPDDRPVVPMPPEGSAQQDTDAPAATPEPAPTQPLAQPTTPTPPPTPAFQPRSAKPRNAPGSWVTPNDYPARDLREGNQGVTGFALTIGADGRVQSCAVTRSSGFAGLDKATCDVIQRRARFEAAIDGNGIRVGGTFSGSIRWQIPRD